MTQRERILAALRAAGRRGITQVDFLRFPTVDGGPPVTRVAARVQELRDEGLDIVSSGTRDRCAVYVLKELGVSTGPVRSGGPVGDAGPVESSTLFDPAEVHVPANPYETEEAA